MVNKILLIGPPGSGKGTQGIRLSELLGLEHVAIGDLLRAEISSGSELGETIKAKVAAGELVDDDLILGLIETRVEEAAEKGYILDGFPRSVDQAKKGRKLAEPVGARPELVIYFDVPDDIVVERLTARAEIEGREDDNEQTIRHRLALFHETTKPLLEFYEKQGKARTIDATAPVDEVTEKILELMRG
ncbi:MAG: adenylate kinase [Nocardiaceae bacterium]|nr:adenylate kinase [Nocardiaceae bacterium]